MKGSLSPSSANSESTRQGKRCPNGIAIAVAASNGRLSPRQSRYRGDREALRARRGLHPPIPNRSGKLSHACRASLLSEEGYKKAASLLHRSSTITSSFSGRALTGSHAAVKHSATRREQKPLRSACRQVSIHLPHSGRGRTEQQRSRQNIHARATPFGRRSQKVPSLNPLIGEAEVLRKYGFDSTAQCSSIGRWKARTRSSPKSGSTSAELGDDRTKVNVVGDLITRYPSLVSRETLELYFPKAFYPLFEKEALDLNPFLLMSVARQESVFNPKAMSPANAQGLLQIHPDTGMKLHVRSESRSPRSGNKHHAGCPLSDKPHQPDERQSLYGAGGL